MADLQQVDRPLQGLGIVTLNFAFVGWQHRGKITAFAQIAIVKQALQELNRSDWNKLGTRQKIDLLKKKVKELRGTGISSQTLYRSYIKDLWD